MSIKDAPKNYLKHMLLVKLGLEKTYSEQQDEFNTKAYDEMICGLDKGVDESSREWIRRIVWQIEELKNGLLETVEKASAITFGESGVFYNALETVVFAFWIDYVDILMKAMMKVSTEEGAETDYGSAISEVNRVRLQIRDISPIGVTQKIYSLRDGNPHAEHIRELYYSAIKVSKHYVETGEFIEFYAGQKSPLAWLGAVALLGAGLLLYGLSDSLSEAEKLDIESNNNDKSQKDGEK